jgi:7-alpha-hydroxysteroid dehydrogenase
VLLDRFRLDGRVAVITGSGRGIGAGCARAFAEAGADVALTARTKEQLDEVAEDVRSLGRRALVMPGDVSDLGTLDRLVEETVGELGHIDIVVNNAGGSMPTGLLDTSVRSFEEAFHFNVTTAFALSKAAIPHMLETDGGSIINISSAMGRLRDRGFVAYGTAKAALAHYTRLAALDLCPRIRVNAIAPGSILTSALDIVASNDELRALMEKVTPMRRLGDPEDIAAAAVYLASPAGSYLTGKTLEVDGGITFPNLDLPIPDL